MKRFFLNGARPAALLLSWAVTSASLASCAQTDAESSDPGAQLGSQSDALHGALSQGTSWAENPCGYTAEEWDQVQRAVFYARVVVSNAGFEQCVQQKAASGGILGCHKQDVHKASEANYAATLITAIDTANDVSIGCDTLGGIYGLARVGSAKGTQREQVLANPGLFSQGLPELADTIVHETLHTKGYTHDTEQACGAPYTDGQSVPWAVARCVNDALLEAFAAEPNIEQCGNGGILLPNTSGAGLECNYAPFGTGKHAPKVTLNTLAVGTVVWTSTAEGTSLMFSATGTQQRELQATREGGWVQMEAKDKDSKEPLRITSASFQVPAAGYLVDRQVVTAYKPSLLAAIVAM